MKDTKENKFNELGKQAYLDSINARKANQDKFNFKSDPILQQNDYYVRLIIFNSIFYYIEHQRI